MNSSFISFSISILLLFSFTTNNFAQKIKYGKVSKKELKMTVYDKDPEAEAVVLIDKQSVNFVYNTSKGFQNILTRHIRYKVFKKSGAEYVDKPIVLYKNGTDRERLSNFKATVFNLVYNNIEKDKLNKKDIFKEEASKRRTLVKYAMPNVQDGSVVDISYTITSDFIFELPTWQYQYDIPVLKSTYFVQIPEYFIYKVIAQGFESASISKSDISNSIMNLLIGTENISLRTKDYTWEAKDVPAFKNEPYMAAPRNYLSQIELELSGTDFPFSYQKNFNESWGDIRSSLMKSSDFGGVINKKRAVKSIVAQITTDLTTDKEKIAAIYQYVQKNAEWNNQFAFYPIGSTKDLLEGKKGYSSDINFMLMQMLRAADLQANPMAVSTRNNGFVNPIIPRLGQFNHVIAAVKMDGKFILLDATDPYCPIGMLPKYDLNERGRLFTDKITNWASLVPTKKDKTVTQAKLSINEEGILTGIIRSAISGYAAKDLRKRIVKKKDKGNDNKDKTHFIDSSDSNEEEGLEVISSSFKDVENINKKIIASYEVKITDKAIVNGDLLYLSPLLFFGIKENPFTSEERKFPIDFSIPIDRTYILQLTIPDSYIIDELPENIAFSLPESGGNFVYEFKKVNKKLLQLTYKFSIKKTFYLMNDYLALREFYNLIIEKQGEQVVLKKVD